MDWKKFFKLAAQKVIENCTSVKVWMFLVPFAVSIILFYYIADQHIKFLTAVLKTAMDTKDAIAFMNSVKMLFDAFTAWLTFCVSLVGTIVVVREVFKVTKLNAIVKSNNESKELHDELKDAKL